MIQPAEVEPMETGGYTLSCKYNALVESHNDLVRLVMRLVAINNKPPNPDHFIISKNCGCGGGYWWCDEHRKEEEERHNAHD